EAGCSSEGVWPSADLETATEANRRSDSSRKFMPSPGAAVEYQPDTEKTMLPRGGAGTITRNGRGPPHEWSCRARVRSPARTCAGCRGNYGSGRRLPRGWWCRGHMPREGGVRRSTRTCRLLDHAVEHRPQGSGGNRLRQEIVHAGREAGLPI